MLAVMKKKATEAAEKGSSGAAEGGPGSVAATAANGDAAEEVNGDAAERDNNNIVTTFDTIDGKPMYNAILSTLKPRHVNYPTTMKS